MKNRELRALSFYLACLAFVVSVMFAYYGQHYVRAMIGMFLSLCLAWAAFGLDDSQ